MNRFRHLIRSVVLLVTMPAFTLAPLVAAHAAPGGAKPPTDATGWTTYIFALGGIMLGVVLGMFALLKQSRRRDRATPEVYQEARESKDDSSKP